MTTNGMAHRSRQSHYVIVLLMVGPCLPGLVSRVSAQCETQKIAPADGATGDQFGTSVDVSGDTLIVGVPLQATLAGAAYIYVRQNGQWIKQAKLLDPLAVQGFFEFGRAVSVDGDFAAVGVPLTTVLVASRGVVHMFRRSGTAWALEQLALPTLISTTSGVGVQFGASVSVDGDAVLVGAPTSDEIVEPAGIGDSGSAYVMRRGMDGVWSREATLLADDAAELDQFGYKVLLRGNTAFVTAFGDKDPLISPINTIGSVYVFNKQGSSWVQTQKLVPSDAAAQAALGARNFGRSLGTDGPVLIVGERSGQSAYVFRFNGSLWVEEAILKKPAVNTGSDQFGNSVAISGDIAMVGAPLDDDNSLSNSGTLFVYHRIGGTWTAQPLFYGSAAVANGRLGSALASRGTYAVAGEIQTASKGAAYVLAVQPVPDCDGNLEQDECQLRRDPSLDSDLNGILDGCRCQNDSECIDAFDCTLNACNLTLGVCEFPPAPGFCFIAGVCHSEGATNPANECEVCSAANNHSDWSNQVAQTPCGDATATDCDGADQCDGNGQCEPYLVPDDTLCSSDGDSCTWDICQTGVCAHPPATLAQPCGVGDCNCNSILDACDVALGIEEDCNGNEIPDACELGPFDADSGPLSPIGTGFPQSFHVSDVPPADGVVNFTFLARADLFSGVEWIDVFLNGTDLGRLFAVGGHDCPASPDSAVLTVPADQFNALVIDGDATVVMQPSPQVDPGLCTPPSSIRVRITYTAATDCNQNGVPDECEPTMDSDGDAVPDICDNCVTISNPGQEDADGDSIGDACDNCWDYASDDQSDADSDGIGDACDNCLEHPNSDQADSDGDGFGDACDPRADLDGDADVDWADFAVLALCLSGPDSTLAPVGCDDFALADIDGDTTVSLADFARLQTAFAVGPSPASMALIPAGEFLMGNSFNEAFSWEFPLHPVYVDAFYMDRYEVTNQQYADALNWAYGQGNLITVTSGVVYNYNSGTSFGYCDTTTSSQYSRITWNGSTFGVVAGKENHPMVRVSWYGSAAYANWRSGIEGRTPCYDTTTWACNFAANGYRLPTEAEWEKAARGGANGHRFPWSDSDTIQHARANYDSSSSYSYDTSPTSGYHPTFAVGNFPYTSPAGYFAPNGYGLYDMAGNVWEWNNDWFASNYYSTSTYNNPHGPTSGTYRVLRGGSWKYDANDLRCARRHGDFPYNRYSYVGFRLALDSGCLAVTDCDDGNDCTDDTCATGTCTHSPRAAGVACGDVTSSNCDSPDSCDGAGTCVANHAPDGTACDDGNPNTPVDECNMGVCAELSVPPGMALIPAGEFLMGDSFNEGWPEELPRHPVYVNAFYMDRYEVSNQLYADALNWAWSQGNLITVISGVVYKYNSGTSFPYCSTTSALQDSPNFGQFSRITWDGSTFGVVAGKENHPMVMVSWWGSAAYSNWRSGMEGRAPSYDTSTWACDFAANGYRLPTEAEWEKAARGGASGHRFPWLDSDTVQHARANYYSSTSYAYDTSPTRGYHPTFSGGGSPYTSPAGYFAPNGYGLYDMAGNVWEWGNDWWDGSDYTNSPYDNPRGLTNGIYRVLRGGSWGNYASDLRCAYRLIFMPFTRFHSIGFRLALDFE